MKKRIFSFLCATALCLGLLSLPVSMGASETPCFMAVNDKLLRLEDQFIPITVGRQYYVPYTVLDSSVAEVSLGVFPIYNAILGTLTIYSQEQQVLTFELATGICTDRSGTQYSVWLVNRNGRIYVPVRFVCEYFGLAYSTHTTAYGPMVRIRSASSKLDDAGFVGLAQMMMENRLREWRRSQTAEAVPATTPTPTSAPASPSTSTAPTTVPSVSQPASVPNPIPSTIPEGSEEDKRDVRTYLTFRADQISGLEDLLSQLEQYRIKALFFFPAAELSSYDSAVRRVLCGGHTVGLLVSGSTVEEASAEAAEGNRLLARIAHLHANIVLAPAMDDSTRVELEAAGLLCLSPDVDAQPDGRSASSQSSAVLRTLEQNQGRAAILSDASLAGAALIRRVLPELMGDGYDVRLAVETELRN